MATIEESHISGIQIVHPFRQVPVRSANEKVEVIVHQRPGERSPIAALRDSPQEPHPEASVRIVYDDRPSLQSSAGDVVNAVIKIDAQRSCHGPKE